MPSNDDGNTEIPQPATPKPIIIEDSSRPSPYRTRCQRHGQLLHLLIDFSSDVFWKDDRRLSSKASYCDRFLPGKVIVDEGMDYMWKHPGARGNHPDAQSPAAERH